jgi:hypothetical protein
MSAPVVLCAPSVEARDAHCPPCPWRWKRGAAGKGAAGAGLGSDKPAGPVRNLRRVIRGAQGEYPLCLLDTMAVSEMVKRPAGMFRHFLEWSHAGSSVFVPCFTVYTVMELRRKPDLFDSFIERFEPYPCVLLRGYMELLEDEVAQYPDPSQIDVCAIAFVPAPLGGEGNGLPNLRWMLDLAEYVEREHQWNVQGPRIVEGMASLVRNYPPENGSAYTTKEVEAFQLMASLPQLVYHGHSNFVNREIGEGRAVDLDAFPSLKAMTYTVFHKFYSDRNRKTLNSDAFDVLTASALPYVEAFITEAHQAEVIRKTKGRDPFLGDLQVYTLRDFRNGAPTTFQTRSAP